VSTTCAGRCGAAGTKRWLVAAIGRAGRIVRRRHSLAPRHPDRFPSSSCLVPPSTAELSETAWAQIAALVQPAVPRRGRPSGDLRRQLEGMLAVMHSGGPWREVPPACGPWQTIYTRYALWVRTGLWERITAILHPDPAQTEPAAASSPRTCHCSTPTGMKAPAHALTPQGSAYSLSGSFLGFLGFLAVMGGQLLLAAGASWRGSAPHSHAF